MSQEVLVKIKESLVNLDLDRTIDFVKKAIEYGVKPIDIINVLADGMKIVGDLYERGVYFVADLIIASEIFKEIMNILEPLIMREKEVLKPIGRVVIGTVEGDIHDIGKNLVTTMLRANGFEVIDLGVDVSPQKFVDAVKQYKPDIVGMSALLTSTMINMKKVIEALEKEGLRDKVKVIVGGAPLTEKFAKEIGADAYGENAVIAVEICRKLVEELRRSRY
ncbi:MAG: corrinoid protein [Desulfurococcaceae archaeon]|nr:corrinoid protein [Desulfurococcaceae archaeon]